jgi:predicted dehydrogenase
LIEHPAEGSAPLDIHLKQASDAADAGVPSSPLLEDPYTAEIRHFYDVIAHDVPARVAPEDGAAAVKIALAAIESARTGQRVRLQEVG